MKKVVSLLLVLVMVLGLSTTAMAAVAGKKIKSLDSGELPDASQDLGELVPGQKITLWNEGDLLDAFVPDSGTTYSKSQLEKIGIEFRTMKGGAIVDKIEFKDIHVTAGEVDKFNVVMTMIDPYVSTGESEFVIRVYFRVDGKRSDQQSAWNNWYCELTGTLENPVTDLEDDEDYVDCSDGQVANAKQYLKAIKIDLGNGVEAVVNMANKKKIYARAYTDGDLKDEAIFDKYKSIELAYTIRQVGLSSYSGNFISLTDADPASYIYGRDTEGNLKYLGRGGDKLPYSDKYYVSNAKIDLEEDTDEVPDEVPAPPANNNANPGTGR